ncbi:MAG TPA: hypothetical protein VFO63_18390 [Blastocatellia bacterium]|nr:hypothetical protein [Blastocatellia bacterium]
MFYLEPVTEVLGIDPLRHHSRADPLIKKLSLLDLRHGSSEILEVFQSFPGPYQMLPSPFVSPPNDSFYESSLYKEFKVSQKCLDAAYKQHHRLRDPGDGDDFDRMIYIAGHNQTTPDGVKDYNKLNSPDSYTVTLNGDGRVSHDLGILTDPDGRRMTSYVVEDRHANLPCNNRIISALDDLLQPGVTDKLERLANRRAKYMTGIRERQQLKKIADARAKEKETLRTLVSQLRSSAADPEQMAGFEGEGAGERLRALRAKADLCCNARRAARNRRNARGRGELGGVSTLWKSELQVFQPRDNAATHEANS